MSIQITHASHLGEMHNVLPMVEVLSPFYPNIGYWFVNKVMPGVMTGKDNLLVARKNETIIGFCLGKRTDEEVKLRCVRVLPEFQNAGLGIRLIDNMLDVLETEKPLVTVPEEMMHNYSRIFVNRYGFDLTHVGRGDYRPNKLEYYFNQ